MDIGKSRSRVEPPPRAPRPRAFSTHQRYSCTHDEMWISRNASLVYVRAGERMNAVHCIHIATAPVLNLLYEWYHVETQLWLLGAAGVFISRLRSTNEPNQWYRWPNLLLIGQVGIQRQRQLLLNISSQTTAGQACFSQLAEHKTIVLSYEYNLLSTL